MSQQPQQTFVPYRDDCGCLMGMSHQSYINGDDPPRYLTFHREDCPQRPVPCPESCGLDMVVHEHGLDGSVSPI